MVLSLRSLFRSLLLLASILTVVMTIETARADILFEGYSKILIDDVHVGYLIVRYEFDSKKQEFSTISLVHTGKTAGNINESLKARSSSSLHPIAYQYTSLANGKGKTIDAVFKGDDMTATIRDDGKPSIIKKKIPKGAFLSSFLAYLMLQGKEGIKPGIKYGYQAIAEEDAALYGGEAFIEKEETVEGLSTFKVLNSFKGAKFVSNVTHKGDVIATRSPVEKQATELVATMEEATAGQTVNQNSIKELFGSIPAGTENAITRKVGSKSGAKVMPKETTDQLAPQMDVGEDEAPAPRPKKSKADAK